MGSHLSCADGPLCQRDAKLTESEGDMVLSRPREVFSSTGSFLVSKIAVASSCLRSLSGYWDIDLNVNRCKRTSVNLCAVA